MSVWDTNWHAWLSEWITPTWIELVAWVGLWGSAFGVLISPHMIGSILSLVFTFIFAAVWCLLLGAEFLAFVLPIVYIGAISVLFLFVIMMIDFRSHIMPTPWAYSLKQVCMNLGGSAILGGFLWRWGALGAPLKESQDLIVAPIQSQQTNIINFGRVLYTQYALLFQCAGLMLLVSMVGGLWLLAQTNSKKKVRKKIVASSGVSYVE